MKPKEYIVLSDAVERGVEYGWNRAYKHTEDPKKTPRSRTFHHPTPSPRQVGLHETGSQNPRTQAGRMEHHHRNRKEKRQTIRQIQLGISSNEE
jgi:hypothetical protein